MPIILFIFSQLNEMNVVHGDIKLDNIMRAADNSHYMVTDFSHSIIFDARMVFPSYMTR